jgi:hypothetical protein
MDKDNDWPLFTENGPAPAEQDTEEKLEGTTVIETTGLLNISKA